MESKIQKSKFDLTNKFIEHSNIYVYCFFPYFDMKEVLILLRLNKIFNQLAKEYLKDWPNQLKIISKAYSLQIDKIDASRLEAVKNKRRYLVKTTVNNFIEIKLDTIDHLASTKGVYWAWRENRSYWVDKPNESSYFNDVVPYLNFVCWLSPRISFINIKKGNYTLYLRHKITGYDLDHSCKLKVLANDDINNILFEEDFATQKHKSNLKEKNMLDNTLITELKLEEDLSSLSLDIFHKNMNGKSGWWIDGIILKQNK